MKTIRGIAHLVNHVAIYFTLPTSSADFFGKVQGGSKWMRLRPDGHAHDTLIQLDKVVSFEIMSEFGSTEEKP